MINLTALLGQEMCVGVLVEKIQVHKDLMSIITFTRGQESQAEQDKSLYPNLSKIDVDEVMQQAIWALINLLCEADNKSLTFDVICV